MYTPDSKTTSSVVVFCCQDMLLVLDFMFLSSHGETSHHTQSKQVSPHWCEYNIDTHLIPAAPGFVDSNYFFSKYPSTSPVYQRDTANNIRTPEGQNIFVATKQSCSSIWAYHNMVFRIESCGGAHALH